MLKHLKGYHRAAILILEEDINSLKRRLRKNADFAQNLENIERDTEQWLKICERKKSIKLERLYIKKSGNGIECHDLKR